MGSESSWPYNYADAFSSSGKLIPKAIYSQKYAENQKFFGHVKHLVPDLYQMNFCLPNLDHVHIDLFSDQDNKQN